MSTNKKIKTFLVSNMYPSEENPTYGTFVKNFVDASERDGMTISHMAVIKGRGNNFMIKLFKYLKFYYDILKIGIKKDYDLIYLHYVTHASIALLILKIFVHKPLIMNAHGSDILTNSFFTKGLQFFSRFLAKQAELFIVPSSYFKEIVSKKFKMRKGNIFVSPSSGLDLKMFKEIVKAKSNLELETFFVVGFLSRLDSGKGWRLYLKALKLIKENEIGINLKGLVIGDGAEKEDFLEKLRDLNLENDVIYLGAKPQIELADYYSAMDIFVFPTQLEESLGLVGLEAMACKTPVIGSKIGGLKSYIIDNKNGFFFSPGDYRDLYKKIVCFYKLSNKKKIQMSKESEKVSKQYDSNRISKNLIKKIEDII